jgi:uncharacterized pyridoxal phosphate-containing UPF0001 family protein
MIITKELLEKALDQRDLSPILTIGLIVTQEILRDRQVIIGFNLLGELQTEKCNQEITLPVELRALSQLEIAKNLYERGLKDEEIINILQKLHMDK